MPIIPFITNLLSNPLFWKIAGVLLLAAALFIGGCRHGEQNIQADWDADKVAKAETAKILLGVQDEISRQATQGYIDKINSIQANVKTITKKVKVYVPANSCPLPAGFRVLHNSAVRNGLPDPAGESDATPTTVGHLAR